MKLKQTIIAILGILGLVAGAWGITEIFVLKPVYEVEMAGVSEQIIQMQRNTQIQRAEDSVFYWMRQEQYLVRQCAARPRDASLINQLNEVRRQRERAEEHLRQLRMP